MGLREVFDNIWLRALITAIAFASFGVIIACYRAVQSKHSSKPQVCDNSAHPPKFNDTFCDCLVCGKAMDKGFSARTHGLSWIPTEKLEHFMFVDKDLNEAGLKEYFPSKAAFDLSYHCPNCMIYIVDYGRSFSRAEANELAGAV